MATFRYKGRNSRGEAVAGAMEAATIDAVANHLFNLGITPIDIDDAPPKPESVWMREIGHRRIELTDLILFCRQMYTLFKAGVPIMQALKGLRESTHNRALAAVIGQINEALDAGFDLTAAVKRHPKVFSTLFVSLIQIGETSGTLDQSFLQLAGYLEREQETQQRIKSATRYPLFVIIALVIATFVINMFVIPAFAHVYTGLHAKLPLATRILMATSRFTVAYWYDVVAVLVIVAFAIRAYARTPGGRYRWHHWRLHLPVVGSIFSRALLGRFARALAITIKSGVPLIQGLTVISRAVDNDYVAARILQMRDGIERGESLTRTAQATALFPPLVLQMISVGEESGSIDTLMTDVAEYYEREVDYDLRNLSTAIEPLLVVAMGVLVLILALGVFLPMWDLAHAAFHHTGGI
ncbi:MAG TPA: type II secretion system F family protein [Acidiferrobacter sp.]|nr:type II secretion system F family protein [Acidiferrobacter sp.]